MKRKKKYYFKKKKRKKKFDLRPPGIEPGPTDSESDVLTTLPSIHMALTRDQAQNRRQEKYKKQNRNLNSAPFLVE